MSRTRIVVDASVLVTLLTDPGNRGASIMERLQGSEIHAPDHLPVEVTNVIRRLHNARVLGPTEASLALRGLFELSIQLWPFEVLVERSWRLGSNLSSYDSAYVALAERLDATLLTADARLSRAPGPECPIELSS